MKLRGHHGPRRTPDTETLHGRGSIVLTTARDSAAPVEIGASALRHVCVDDMI